MALDPDSADPASPPAAEPDRVSGPRHAGRAHETRTALRAADRSGCDGSDLRPLLNALQALCDGDFTARVDGAEEGDAGRDGRHVQPDRRAQRASGSARLQRVRREVVRQGRLDERLTASPGQGSWATSVDAANTLLEALVVPVAKATRVLDAVADGDLTQHVDLHDGKPPAARRSAAAGARREPHGRPALPVHRRGDAAWPARSAPRAGWAGAPRRRACPATGACDRGGQHDGVPADGAGPGHRGRHDGGGARRPHAAGDGRGHRRAAGAEAHGEHHGRPAAGVRRRGHPRGPRGRHRRTTRRPGPGRGRLRRLEGPHRQRQLHGVQPDLPGPQHRPGHHRRRQRRPESEDHRGARRARSCS